MDVKFLILKVIPYIILLTSCSSGNILENGELRVSVKGKSVNFSGGSIQAEDAIPEYLITEEGKIGFVVKSTRTASVNDTYGKGQSLIVDGESDDGDFSIIWTINSYEEFPSTFIVNTEYICKSDEPKTVNGWVSDSFSIASGGDAPEFWSFQGQSDSSRSDWILPLNDGFAQQNFMGSNNPDYGGGIPVSCVWRKDAGIAVGHLSSYPEIVSLPVNVDSGKAHVSIKKDFIKPETVSARDTIKTLVTFIHVFHGDCFKPLRNYASMLEKVGVLMPESDPIAFETQWCAWGYGRTFTAKEVLGTLPKVKELGIKWATIDDGYQIAEGDWEINRKRFKGGDDDMREFVDAIHDAGMKAQLWWAPLCSDPGTPFLKAHPDAVVEDEHREPYEISWWDSWYLSPLDSNVRAATADYVKKVIGDWGFDGFKLDGQHMNSLPLDYNPARDTLHPEAGSEQLPGYFKLIYDTARSIKSDALIQNCPCGDCFSIYNLPYTNQTVASDPESSWQVRLKGYVFHALVPKLAYFGDHVELTDNKEDFPSQLGVGAVLGTKFTYPADNPNEKEKNLLTPEREKIWKNAFSIYNELKLSLGEYKGGVYDIGYDRPEGHLIEKDGNLYFAFYQDGDFSSATLKCLQPDTKYHVMDYYNHSDLGTVSSDEGGEAILNGDFKDFLLIKLSLDTDN